MRHTLIAILSIVFLGGSVHAEIKHIGTASGYYHTINAALAAADPGDTLLIHWESETLSTYLEHVEITKNITLTSTWTPGSDPDERPTIQCSLSSYDDVILIQSENVTVSNLRIRTTSLIPAATGDETAMEDQAGIRVQSNNCTISHCAVTCCRVGIRLEGTLNVDVDSCVVGRLTSQRWEAPTSNAHDGNFFGIVQVEPARTASAYPVGTYKSNRITNCTIARNRFYGVVLRGGSMATVHNNLIVWNGTNTQIPSSSNHYGDGGILCLFTSGEMTGTDVEMQSPMITSNTIYGNDGFQVCVLTLDPGREPRQIANAPILMSNIIGPDTLTYSTAETPIPTSAPNWLISCTSESTTAATPQHGSAPIMAFNNLYRPNASGSERMYFAHPGNPTPTPGAPTSTPAPTRTPTPTGTQYTPSYTFSTPSSYDTPTHGPTHAAIPTRTPTPSGSPTFTPTAGPYKMDAATWSTKNVLGDPRFVGGDSVENFDFHLRDPVFQMTPTPNDPRSVCYDTGGFRLNPGITQENLSPDIGQVDIGAHFVPNVPSVSSMGCSVSGGQQGVLITWVNPTRYADNSLFSDHAGNILYCAYFDSKPETTILSQVILDPCQSYTVFEPPRDTNKIGVRVFNTAGAQSPIMWVDLCE